MSVYQKLNEARSQFHTLKLKKSGLNKFAGYSYFELADFLIPALEVFKQHYLCAYISFANDLATMRIVDVTDGTTIEITSPMSSAALKGCHEVQNLGAVQSYLRRYLWVTAMEIVEHDALDSSEGPAPKKDSAAPASFRSSPTMNVLESLPEARQSIIVDVATAIKERFAAGDVVGAYEEYLGLTDVEEKTGLWSLLDSKVRSAIKKHGETLKG